MKKEILIFFLFCCNYCFAQNEYEHWAVPSIPAYEINFSCDTVSADSISVNENNPDAGATISDKRTGQLLFFTDGQQVWNSNFQQMPNGDSLLGGLECAQPVLIVQQPGSNHIFYVFTTDNSGQGSRGLEYSIVDMDKDNGLGDVIVKNIFLDSSCQKINAVYNVANNSFWVLACNYVTNNFMSFKVDSNGLDTTPVLSPSHVNIILYYQVDGYLKSSADGKSIACVFELPPVVGLYNFNETTGQLSLRAFLPVQTSDGEAFGASFSPDNSKLYISASGVVGFPNNNSEIYQYDVISNDTNAIKSSRITIDSTNTASVFAGMQMGPNEKLYIASEGKDSIGVIEQPDSAGKSCDFILDKITLPYAGAGNLGLSNNIDGLYYFAMPDSNINLSYSILCNKIDSFTINTVMGYNYFVVNFGDGRDTLLDSTQYTFTHQYDSAGTYNVKLNTASGCIQDSVTILVTVDTAKCPVPPPPLSIPTLIYGRGSQTQWSIISLPPNTAATIYDELGRTIYKTSNYPNNYDMRNLPPAMYFYRLTLVTGQEYVGKIVLVK